VEQDHSNRVIYMNRVGLNRCTQVEDRIYVISMIDSIVTYPEHVVLTLDELGRAAGVIIARPTPATA